MKIQNRVVLSAAALCLLAAAARVEAEPAERVRAIEQDEGEERQATFRYKTVTTESGLHFRVPLDMPIVKRGGVEMALPFDEYVYGKFQAMEGRLNGFYENLLKQEDELEKLKKQMVSESNRLSSREVSPESRK